MRKIVLALAAAAAVGLAIPTVATTSADAHTVIVTKRVHRDYADRHDHYYGWHRHWRHGHHHHHHQHRRDRHHHYGWR